MRDATQLTAGLEVCALRRGGTMSCRSQMGPALRGTGLTAPPPDDLPVADLSDAVDVAMGYAHACAVLASGRVACWGSNDGDALGGGEAPTSVVPVAVPLGAAR